MNNQFNVFFELIHSNYLHTEYSVGFFYSANKVLDNGSTHLFCGCLSTFMLQYKRLQNERYRILKTNYNYVSCQFVYFLRSKSKETLATFGGLRHFWAIALWLAPDDPCMTFNPINVLHSGQGFFLPNLVAIEHF